MLRYTKRLLMGVALVLAAAVPAQADPYFTYSISFGPGATNIAPIPSSGTSGGLQFQLPTDGSLGATYQMLPPPGGIAPLSQSIHIADLGITSVTNANPRFDGSTADTFITFTDHNGSFTQSSTAIDLTTTFGTGAGYGNNNLGDYNSLFGKVTTPVPLTGLSFLFANNDLITITGVSFSTGGLHGRFDAEVDTTVGGGGTTTGVSQVPEPSTMLLSCLGLMFLGGAGWRKRRQTVPALVA